MNVMHGAIHAIKDIALDVKKGEIVTLIGSHGAGKTTLGAISRLFPLAAAISASRGASC